ncbi:MAG: hypothetical protein ACJ0PS_00365 [Flavobacteriaceae bacterium]|jgi:hypothetical protein|tara:strand:+ start:740 stop:982 length:243 start_codon:yes stop_codon:yes gene_type:complete
MKKLLFLLLFFKIVSCQDDRDCFTITNKSISNGEFLLVGVFDPNQNTTEDDLTAGLADVNLEVSQSIYNAYEIGDVYCYE